MCKKAVKPILMVKPANDRKGKNCQKTKQTNTGHTNTHTALAMLITLNCVWSQKNLRVYQNLT